MHHQIAAEAAAAEAKGAAVGERVRRKSHRPSAAEAAAAEATAVGRLAKRPSVGAAALVAPPAQPLAPPAGQARRKSVLGRKAA